MGGKDNLYSYQMQKEGSVDGEDVDGMPDGQKRSS
jgi:hypothetical protein